MAEHPLFPHMEKVAPELGAVTIFWGWLDHLLADFIGELAGFDDQRMADVFAANADIRSKIQIAKGLAFIKQPDPAWFDDASALLDWIDTDIRVRRNDYAHARWSAKGRTHRLTKHKMKIFKPQAFQVALATKHSETVTLRNVRRLVTDMRAAFLSLYNLLEYAVTVRSAAVSDEPSPAISYSQYLRLVGPVARRKTNRSTPRRPPRS